MRIDFRARLTGGVLVAMGLIWHFATGTESATALLPTVPGLLFYLYGFLGFSKRIREARTYTILLAVVAGGGLLIGLAGIIELFKGTMGILAFSEQVAFIAVLIWFLRNSLFATATAVQERDESTTPTT